MVGTNYNIVHRTLYSSIGGTSLLSELIIKWMSFLKCVTFKEFYFGASGQISKETKEQQDKMTNIARHTNIPGHNWF